MVSSHVKEKRKQFGKGDGFPKRVVSKHALRKIFKKLKMNKKYRELIKNIKLVFNTEILKINIRYTLKFNILY